MPSKFGWVDFTAEDRQRMLDVVRLFREQDTRDELGMGTIRDAFADHFFPGTSTIQTRAKYFLFIPWIYLIAEQKKISTAEIKQRARSMEVRLIHTLLETEDVDGVIGREAMDKLQRLPSMVYWNGLGSWGIRVFPGSRSQYHLSLNAYYRRSACQMARTATSTREYETADRLPPVNWHPGLPDRPAHFPYMAEMALTTDEAEYLAERILLRHGHSLLARLLSNRKDVDVGFAWNHPLVVSLSAELQDTIRHSRYFSEAMHGAALLYNLMLARKLQSARLEEKYMELMADWSEEITSQWAGFWNWYAELTAFWECPALRTVRIPTGTRAFVRRWMELLFEGPGPHAVAGSRPAQDLIYAREAMLKRNRARLGNPRALEMWSGQAGTRQLNYRWPNARRILSDIIIGLDGEADDA